MPSSVTPALNGGGPRTAPPGMPKVGERPGPTRHAFWSPTNRSSVGIRDHDAAPTSSFLDPLRDRAASDSGTGCYRFCIQTHPASGKVQPFGGRGYIKGQGHSGPGWTMRWVVAWPLVGLGLAGCIGGENAEPGSASSARATVDGAANLTANESIALLPDPWLAGETERVLFEGTVSTSEPCNAAFSLPEGTLVPDGTKRLRFETDATAALKAGQYHSEAYSYGNRWLYPGDSPEAVHAFMLELEPRDWDPVLHATSGYTFYVQCNHDGGLHVLDGAIKAKIVAERDPAWVPLPLLDAWTMPEAHRIPQPGALTLLDHNATWECGALVELYTGLASCPEFPPLADTIPYGATKLVLAMAWSQVQGCPPTHTCHMRSPMESGGHGTAMGDGIGLEHGDGYALLIYDVPGMAGEDGPYVNQSSTRFYPWIDGCTAAETYPRCVTNAPTRVTTDVRFVVEAWKGDVDVDALKTRLGVS